MTSRRTIRSILHNFLGTYTSRYTDYDGYWLFGMIVDEIDHLLINLISPISEETESSPKAVALQIAVRKFAEQARKNGLQLSHIQHAELEVIKHPAPRKGEVNGKLYQGHDVTFRVRATLINGRICEDNITLFVAPHDPAKEHRSSRQIIPN